jgi:LmbE family N-acetylglucosaminyl deacetylase
MTWEVFYAPHTDDETLGMVGAIIRAREIGRKVLVVLVTDNEPSTRGKRLFGEDEAFAARRVEWTKAMAVLGVDEITTWELSEERMRSNPVGTEEDILRMIHELNESRVVVHHHTTWGKDDIHASVIEPTLAHVLCANALMIFQKVHPLVRCSLHAVYIYSHAPINRIAPYVQNLSPDQMRLKIQALNCYKQSHDTVGYGYASVPELFDGAATDPREFIQELPL